MVTGSAGVIVSFGLPNPTTPILPDVNGLVNFTSTGGTITITGVAGGLGAQSINLDLAGGGGAVDTITVQAATVPGVVSVTPTALGVVTYNGAIVAAHSVPVESRSRALNAYNLEVQLASVVSATPVNTNSCGLSCFNTAQFTIDNTSGMVSLKGGSVNPPITGVTPDAFSGPGTSPVIADASGNITIEGGATFASNTQANPIRTNSLAANKVDLQIQLAGSNASSSTANKFGVAQFDSNYFTVTSGYVTDALASYSFSAYLSANTAAVTGDSTEVLIPFNTDSGTGFDPNSNFNTGTSQYTTPVQGEYEFEMGVRLEAGTGLMAAKTRIVAFLYARDGGGVVYNVAEGGNYTGVAACALPTAPNNDAISVNIATRMRLPAGYTVEGRCQVNGAALNTLIGGLGGATKITYLSGRCVATY